MNKHKNLLLTAVKAITISLLVFGVCACSNSYKQNDKTDERQSEVWFMQTSVDLGAKIRMIDEENGFAISRGKGDDVKGKVLLFNKGMWKSVFEYGYSDFPIITQYDSTTIWWVIHETHHGKYKPRLYSYTGGIIKEIELPPIMWNETDFSMWTSVSVLQHKKTWMVGQQGNIISFDGSRWKTEINPANRKTDENLSAGDLNDVHMISENLGWAVGKQGIILKYKNGRWSRFNSPTVYELKSISMLDENFGWIVGERGTILKYENGKWNKLESSFRVSLNCVKALSKDKAWIAGSKSTLLEYKAGNWIENKSIKNFEDNFVSLDAVKTIKNEYKLWAAGYNGIYTNSQSLKFSFTDVTENVSLRKEGRAGIFRDINNDDFPDLITIQENGPPVIYKNQNGNVFSEVARDFSSGQPDAAQAIASADFDNDGNIDILEIQDDVNNKLVFGKGNFAFREVNTREYIHPEFIQTDLSLAAALTADFNNDGSLDFYISNYNYADMVFKNNGAGKFTDATQNSGITKTINHRSYGAVLSDFNNDGLIDILITYKLPVDKKYLHLFINKGNFRFESKADSNFFTEKAPSTYAAISDDFNNDGFPDLIVFNNEFHLQVLINDGKANFTDVTKQAGFTERFFHPEPSGGILAAADVNNDGWLDLFIGSRLFLNSSQFKFTEVGKSVGIDFLGNPSFADYDNDGDVDLFIGSSKEALGKGERAILYRNNLISKNFIKVKLNGDASNRNAIGAKVFLLGYDDKGKEVYKTVRQNGIGSNSISQQDCSVVHFGADPALFYKAKIIFPSGKEQIVDAEINQTIDVYESSFFTRNVILTKKSFARTLLLINWQLELIKFTLVFLILTAAFFYGKRTKARKVVYHVYIGLLFFTLYLLLIHLTITQPPIISALVSIGITSAAAFGFVLSASYYIEIKESKYISHFKLQELLGEGGMGKVYKAFNRQENITVAVKILNPHLMKDEENKKRLASEGRLLASLNHPNIVKVLEFGETAQHAFVAMEYLSGGTLYDFIERNYPLSEEHIVEIAKQICSGLKIIHANNIIHRDLKTQNVMFDERGSIKIMDFGLSKSPLVSTMTTLGTVVGTLGFVAPEQVTNINVDHRVDIFSLGVIVYQMLTKKLPFSGENEIALIHSIFNTVPQNPTEINKVISPKLEALVLKCLEKNVENRFQSAEEVICALQSISKFD